MDRNAKHEIKNKVSALGLYLILLLSGMAVHGGELYVLAPPNYFSPSVLKAAESLHGITIQPTYYHSVEMREHNLNSQTEQERYDIVIIAAESARDYVSEGKAQKLNALLFERNRTATPQSQDPYGLFLSYSAMGLAYHRDRVKPLYSWAEFFDLPQSYYGRIVLPHGHQDVMDAATFAVGASTSVFNNEQITEAGRVLMRFLQRLRPVIVNKNDTALLDGLADYQLTSSTVANKLKLINPNIEFIYPDKKTRIRQLLALVSSNTRKTKEAMQFLDVLSSTEGALQQERHHHFAVSNVGSNSRSSVYPGEDIEMDFSQHANPRLEMRKAYLHERIADVIAY